MPSSLDYVHGMRGKVYPELRELRFEGRVEFSKTRLWEWGVRPCTCQEALPSAVGGPASILLTDVNAEQVH